MFKLVKIEGSGTNQAEPIRMKTSEYATYRAHCAYMCGDGTIDSLDSESVPTYIALENAEPGEKESILCGGISSADHNDGLSLIKGTVAGGTIGNAATHKLFFLFDAKLPRSCPCGDHDRFCEEYTLACFDHLGICAEIDTGNLCVFTDGTEFFGLSFHAFGEGAPCGRTSEVYLYRPDVVCAAQPGVCPAVSI